MCSYLTYIVHIMPDTHSNSDRLNDLLFTIRYIPKILKRTVQYGVLGAVMGVGMTFLCKDYLSKFAEEHHNAVDLVDGYVADDEEYLHLSRTAEFNRVTPPISEFLPIYSSIVGAGAGTFFALSRVKTDYQEQLAADRELRRISVMV
ncbi:hypothetical protein [uncultured Legionella sp.]|uniref:hypothetical protein n=1 Tax=uncultured Legionella sp. TaxID=210934 RepID=UPI00261BDA93|nr:hypothetical protein [uncultured Legionella sp.]